ncbi:DNA polymerase Y family protein [Streptomyces xanthophaeus]|uniref:DNA polymerase Y family protein n=1 Tax=Streptomyces xanthophaeus TaxID=67385 RepID=UPI00371D15EA
MAAVVTPPGTTTVIGQEDTERWLRPRPVAALHGVGPATAAKLRTYGLHTIGDIADTPTPTLVRLFGAAAARALHAHALGLDPRPVQSQPMPKSLGADGAFSEDALDPAAHRRAVLGLAEEVATRLRDGRQIAGGLSLTVSYADRTSRTLTEATAHTRPLTAAAYELYDLLGLQRARVRGISLRAQDLRPAEQATEQLTLEPADGSTLAVEAVTARARARARFGPGSLRPATLAGSVHENRDQMPGGGKNSATTSPKPS